MQASFRHAIRDSLQDTKLWLRRSINEWRHCRTCGGGVTPLDRICSHCGAGNPVKLSAVQSVLLGGSLAEALLLWVCLM